VFSERACPDKGISIFASAIHFLGVVVVVVLEFNLRMPSLLGKHLPLDSSPGSVIFHVGSQFLPKATWNTILLPMQITELVLQLCTAVLTPGSLVEMGPC
jgi:hypothetical protein